MPCCKSCWRAVAGARGLRPGSRSRQDLGALCPPSPCPPPLPGRRRQGPPVTAWASAGMQIWRMSSRGSCRPARGRHSQPARGLLRQAGVPQQWWPAACGAQPRAGPPQHEAVPRLPQQRGLPLSPGRPAAGLPRRPHRSTPLLCPRACPPQLRWTWMTRLQVGAKGWHFSYILPIKYGYYR
jgi:hypothetical protein